MTLQTTTSGYYAGLTLAELEKIIMWELGQVIGTTVSYSKFPQWLIRQKLNNRQNQFVSESKCIKKFALLICKEGYREYKLPINCMEDGVISAKYYISSDSYQSLDIRDTDYLDEHEDGWLVSGNGTPRICYTGNMYGNIPMLGVHQPPDVDGTNYTLSPETGITTGGDLPGATNNITGQATSGSATTLNDTAVDFTTMGLVSGMAVNNVTDGSSAVITTIAATQLGISTLSGGTSNVFAAGNSYEILSGEYGVVTSWESEEAYLFGSEVGLLTQLTVPAGNIRVDYIPYPLSFPEALNDNQYPEIPKLYHHDGLAMGVVADLLRTFNEGTKEFQRAAYYEAIAGKAIAKAKGLKNARPFSRKPTGFRPRVR